MDSSTTTLEEKTPVRTLNEADKGNNTDRRRRRGPRDRDRFLLAPEIGAFVRKKRLAQGMDRAELARRANIQYDQVKVVETMVNRSVARRTMEAIMEVLDIVVLPAASAPTPDPDRYPLTPEMGVLVREKRLARGMSRTRLARYAGVQYSQVKAIEILETRTVALRAMLAIMALLDITELPETSVGEPMTLWWTPPTGSVKLSRSLRCLIRRLRETATLTQTKMAALVGVSTSSYQLLEYDKSNVGCAAVTIARVVTILKVRPEGRLGHGLENLGFCYVGGPPRVDWDHVPLGEQSDGDLATQLGLPLRRVYCERQRRGIAAYAGPHAPKSPNRTWTAGRLQETLGDAPRFPDGKIDWHRVPLGSCHDTEIARWLGVKSMAVSYKRRTMGIPKYEPVLWDLVPLGKYPDTVIAAWVGTTVASVVDQRRSRKIAAAPAGKRRDRGASYSMKLNPHFLASPELRFPERPKE